jgi:hypothetical protein
MSPSGWERDPLRIANLAMGRVRDEMRKSQPYLARRKDLRLKRPVSVRLALAGIGLRRLQQLENPKRATRVDAWPIASSSRGQPPGVNVPAQPPAGRAEVSNFQLRR